MPLPAAVAAAGLAAAGGIAQGIINSKVNNQNVDKTIAANRYLAEYSYSKDLEMWNRSNQYNSPAAQMQRLKDAGLNPNLVYGSGAVGNTSGAIPKYNTPTAEYSYKPPVDIPMMLSMFQDFQIKNAQIDNLKAQREAMERTILNKDLQNNFLASSLPDRLKKAGGEAELAWDRSFILDKQFSQMLELFPYQLDYARGRVGFQSTQQEKMLQETKKVMSQTEYQKLINDWYVTKTIGTLIGQGMNSVTKMFPVRTPLKINRRNYD